MGKVIQIKRKKAKSKRKRIIQNNEIKYYTKAEIKLLRRKVRDACILALEKNQKTAVREWAIIDTLTSSGIRVAECSNLRCGDLNQKNSHNDLFVRFGKGAKSRTVEIPPQLKTRLKSYLKWKEQRGEPTGPDDFLFLGQKGPMGRQGIQFIVKKWLKKHDLYENGKSVHALRHSYAVQYYRREHDLRGLQKQLGHSSIVNTMIYTHCIKEDIQRQVQDLWG